MLFLFKNILSLEECRSVDKAEISAIDITLQNSCSALKPTETLHFNRGSLKSYMNLTIKHFKIIQTESNYIMKIFYLMLLLSISLPSFSQFDESEITPITRPEGTSNKKVNNETVSKTIKLGNGDLLITKNNQVVSDDSDTPPLVINIQIGDSIITLIEGESYNLTGNLNNASVSFTSADYKLFNKKGVQFAFPGQYTYKNDDEASSTWSIVADDYTLFIGVNDKPVEIKDSFESLVKMYKKQKIKVEHILDYDRTINGIEMTGKSVVLSMMGALFRQDMFTVKGGDGTVVFTVSDYLTSSGGPSKEALIAFEYLENTLKIE